MDDGGDDDLEHIWVLLKRGKNVKIVDLNLEMITQQDTLIVKNESVHNSLKKYYLSIWQLFWEKGNDKKNKIYHLKQGFSTFFLQRTT
jgi:hypothetical protein